MKKRVIVMIGAAILAAVIPARATVSQQTLDNIETAFRGESNAEHRYEAFAKRADEEGKAYAARLFRAASAAEAIHKANHKKAILSLGGKIKDFKLDEVKAGATAENLKGAVKGETYERDIMYPDFLVKARQDDSQEAIRTLLYAQKAEAEHATLFQQALDNLEQKNDARIYVCKVCGYTVTKLPDRNCRSCRESVSEYVRID